MCGELVYANYIARLWVMAVLYGVYMILFAACVYVYTSLRSGKWQLAICIVLFVLTSAQVYLDFVNTLLTPLLVSGSIFDSGSLFPCEESDDRTHQANLNSRINNASIFFYITKMLLGDGLLVYRCYVVWTAKRSVVILPAVLLFITGALGYTQVAYEYQYYYAQLRAQSTGLSSDKAHSLYLGQLLYRINTASTSTSIATNVLVTGLIVARIWWDTRGLQEVFGRTFSKKYKIAMSMMIESGAMYTASLLAALITDCYETPAAYIANYVADQFTGMLVVIAPSLIIIRVALGKGHMTTMASMSEDGQSRSRRGAPQSIVFAHVNSTDRSGDTDTLQLRTVRSKQEEGKGLVLKEVNVSADQV